MSLKNSKNRKHSKTFLWIKNMIIIKGVVDKNMLFTIFGFFQVIFIA